MASADSTQATTPTRVPQGTPHKLRGADARINPRLDVRDHAFLADVVEKVVVVPVIQFERLVPGSSSLVEELTTLTHRGSVARPMHDQQWQRDTGKLLFEPLISTDQRRDSDRGLDLMRGKGVVVQHVDGLPIA